ncbi:MAG: S-adenosylmethionine:tRNA ribosyltransferase-isomerase [Nocardioidaceae bacterium]|nr:S-adenosylmethionine:tRNA ribosyltransferase-isomerase [Nocardioidaceae bacterium]
MTRAAISRSGATRLGATTRFVLPPDSEATAPAERRGLARDGVRLLVAAPAGIVHATFRDLGDHLSPGDLVVVNTSATLPAAVDAHRPGHVRSPLHVATELDDGSWVVEVRSPDNTGPAADVRPGETLQLTGGITLSIEASYPMPGVVGARLWKATPSTTLGSQVYLADHGRPVRYGYLNASWPLGDLQNVYADEPGSAEMASAGRPFTHRLLVRLLARGVVVAPVTLHTGVSSPEKHEPPMPERYDVPAGTADLVNLTHSKGRRVVAVGTTVTRALESAAEADGSVRAAHGWTDLVLGPDRPARVVTGLTSGLHEPEASHLLLLEAVAGRDLVGRAYAAAVAEHYLWHEFGDSMLFLPKIARRVPTGNEPR